jgi:hypothetical protein
MDDIELSILRGMTAARKLEVVHSLLRTARSLAEAGIRLRHPEYAAEQVEAAVRDRFARADS